MEIIFKNSVGASKGKQCQQFLSILKKLKFQLSTKDKMLSFYVDKTSKKFIMTTYSARNLQDPPAGSPLVFTDYDFGQDMYNLSNYAFDKPVMFSFDIQDIVKLINHYYQTKMSLLSLTVQSDISQGLISFQVPDEVQGGVPLNVQRLNQFPHAKNYQNKDFIDYFPLFQLNDEYFQKLKEIQDVKYNCFYEIHEEGIYLKNYTSKMEGNKYLLSKDDLNKYDSVEIKQKLRGNIYIMEADNYLMEQIKIGVKKHYKKMDVSLIIVRRREDVQVVKNAYIEIQAHLALFPKSLKRTIVSCEISSQINPQGFLLPQVIPTQQVSTNLLKSEQPVYQGLRRVILNRWVNPRAAQQIQERAEIQRQRNIMRQPKQLENEPRVKKLKFKFQVDDD